MLAALPAVAASLLLASAGVSQAVAPETPSQKWARKRDPDPPRPPKKSLQDQLVPQHA